MKILIIQEKGRHQKNWMFRESLSIQRALSKMNVESTVWGLNYDNFSTPFWDLEKEHDVILLIENYPQTDWLPDLSKSNKLKLFWSIDSHVVLNEHIQLCKKFKIDVVLNAVYGHEKFFNMFNTEYFPNAYCDELIKPLELEKIHDVGFCGNINNRGGWLNEIKKYHNLKLDEFVIGEDMVRAINSYKIHFNRNIADDLNYRTFETLGCGTFILTNETPGLSDLFDIGKNIVTYSNEWDLLDKINYYLKNITEREKITLSGYEHVKNKHTFIKRMKELNRIINTYI